MEKKKWIELIGSVFVALIFLSSYAAFGNGKTASGNTTTIAQTPTTVRAEANGVARILSYGQVLNITIHCQNASNVSRQINDFLSTQNTSTVAFPPYSGQNASQIIATAGQAGSYYLYNALSKDIGAYSGCTDFSSSADILLPSRMTFVVEGSSMLIQIPGEFRNSSQPVLFTSSMSNTMNVFVDAILTLNGSIYQGNIRVKELG